MEVLYTILSYMNTVLMTVCGIAFAQQFIYVLLFFLPDRKVKISEQKHKFAVFIPARNEQDIIGDTVKCLINQNYPKELFDVYVIANNCTDNTANVARDAGAIVLEHSDSNPKHKKVSYALEFFFDYILKSENKYDGYIRFDADNYVAKNYISRMNDALASGAKLARGYNHAKNLTENTIAGISGLWYIRDCRFACQARSFLGSTQMMVGSGMMISHTVIEEDNGWIALGTSEDAEFTMNQLFKKNKVTYVKDAIVYEDQPTTLKDTYRRNVRMGSGLIKLFFTHGLKSLGLFFKRLRYEYLDMFLNLLFIPIAIICCVWIPLYYTYDFIYSLTIQNYAHVEMLLNVMGISLICAFALPFILQALLVCILEKKKINQPIKKLIPIILLFPLFMIVYAIGITIGSLSKPKWKQISRSKVMTITTQDNETENQNITKLQNDTENILLLNEDNCTTNNKANKN